LGAGRPARPQAGAAAGWAAGGSDALVDRHELQVFRTDVVGARADDLVVDALLDDVRAQPEVRAITNSGVNIAVGTPIMW
jgi:hypothetical protein